MVEVTGSKELNIYYGRANKGKIFVVDISDEFSWYALEGSTNVNCCWSELLIEGINIEIITDIDSFQADLPITSLCELTSEVIDYLQYNN